MILDGLQYIEQSKLDRGRLEIGRNVVVIGAGNTAIDCATIARRLGAERVTMVYRRTEREMTAYRPRVRVRQAEGVAFRIPDTAGRASNTANVADRLRAVPSGADASGRPRPGPSRARISTFPPTRSSKPSASRRLRGRAILDLETERGFIKVDDNFETSFAGSTPAATASAPKARRQRSWRLRTAKSPRPPSTIAHENGGCAWLISASTSPESVRRTHSGWPRLRPPTPALRFIAHSNPVGAARSGKPSARPF